MSIEQELGEELRAAMRAGDKPRRDVIRQIQTEATVAKAAPGFHGDTGDAFYRGIIAGYVKRMEKAIEEYRGLGERGGAMAGKLSFEVDYLARWLPTRLGEDETRRLVAEAIAELGAAADPKAAGRVTGHIIKSHKDDVDGALVSRLVREALGA